MHVFFEDDGAFKAGTVLADNDGSLQVEAASGKRIKVKAADALKAAQAGVERKRREAAEIAAWVESLKAHRLPDALLDKLPMLLYKPDKLALETRALVAACDALHTNPLALLAACGAIASS